MLELGLIHHAEITCLYGRRAPKEEASPSKKDTKSTKRTKEDLASGEMPSAELLALLNAEPSTYIPALVRLLTSRLPGVIELAATCLAAYDIASGKGSSKLLATMKDSQVCQWYTLLCIG